MPYVDLLVAGLYGIRIPVMFLWVVMPMRQVFDVLFEFFLVHQLNHQHG